MVKSAERTLQVLELLTAMESPLTFSQIAGRLGYPLGSLHGLLATLVGAGWLDYDETSRRYSLGLRTVAAGNAYMRSFELPERARPFMTAIRDELDETVQLSVLDGRYNVYVAKVNGQHPLRLASEVGRRLPAHATGLGKVLLAGLTPAQLRQLFEGVVLERFTQNTITDLRQLQRCLQAIRRYGHGTDDEEYTLGVRCIATPIRNEGGDTVAAMSVSVPTARFDARKRKETLQLLLEQSGRLSTAVGYPGQNSLPHARTRRALC